MDIITNLNMLSNFCRKSEPSKYSLLDNLALTQMFKFHEKLIQFSRLFSFLSVNMRPLLYHAPS